MSVGIGPVDALVQRPLAHHPVMLSGWINAYYGLIRATRHRRTPYFLRSSGNHGHERVPNLICVSVRACHPHYPGGPIGSKRLLLPRPHWSSPSLHKLNIHMPALVGSTRLRNEADSGSLALRPARLLALHQQGLLLPSFHRPGHPNPASAITTWPNSQFPGLDFHQQDTQPYGLHAEYAEKNLCKNLRNWRLVVQKAQKCFVLFVPFVADPVFVGLDRISEDVVNCLD